MDYATEQTGVQRVNLSFVNSKGDEIIHFWVKLNTPHWQLLDLWILATMLTVMPQTIFFFFLQTLHNLTGSAASDISLGAHMIFTMLHHIIEIKCKKQQPTNRYQNYGPAAGGSPLFINAIF